MRDDEEINPTAMFIKFALLIFGVIILLIALFGSFYTIDAGERGILLTWGSPDATPKEPGLHFKIPIAQTVKKMDVKVLRFDAQAGAASKDLQTASTEVAVNYHLNDDSIVEVYRSIGLDYETKVIQPAVQESVKASTALYTAEELVTKRPEVKDRIDQVLRERLLKYNIVVDTVSITDFKFSEAFDNAIEAKVTAEQDALAAKNKLEQVKYEAEQRLTQSRAEAEAIRIQAEAIRSQGGEEYVNLQAINKWDGKLPQFTGGGVIPFINIEADTSRTNSS